MDAKKNILLLTTGGPLPSKPGDGGLVPQRADAMAREVAQLRTYYHIAVEDIMCMDSSNIRPEEWQQIARQIFRQQDHYDGIVVSHGTDTMAYTASAVTFMLPGVRIPVVFTGSQVPLTQPLSDGADNLQTAFAMAASGKPGVLIAFDRKVMRGCRAVKVRASGFSAFESVNARYVGVVSNQGLVIDPRALPKANGPTKLLTEVSRDVFLLKLTPGLSPDIFTALLAMGYKGIVLEAFGLGGINIVVTTQCLYDSSNLQVYQVGTKILELGVIQGRDMTSEAAMTKLMWAIGQGMDQNQVAALFRQSLAGEITVDPA